MVHCKHMGETYIQRINNMILRELWDILTIKNGIKWDVLYDTTIDIIGLMDLGVPENGWKRCIPPPFHAISTGDHDDNHGFVQERAFPVGVSPPSWADLEVHPQRCGFSPTQIWVWLDCRFNLAASWEISECISWQSRFFTASSSVHPTFSLQKNINMQSTRDV